MLTDREDNEAYLAARSGEAYALYFTDGGAVGLKLEDVARKFTLRWIDISTGQWAAQTDLTGGKTVRIEAPGKGHWLAVITR